MNETPKSPPNKIYLHNPWNVEQSPCGCGKDVAYVPESALTTIRDEARRAALDESAESIINEAGKVGLLMNLAAASARREERAAVKSMLEDYFKHFFCTCHGSTRTGGHFASCPTTIRDEVLGRLAALEAAEKGERDG